MPMSSLIVVELIGFVVLALVFAMFVAYFRRVRSQLHSGQHLLQSVLDHTDNGVMALDAEYRVIFVNRRYLELWQLDEEFLRQGPTIGAVIEEVCRRGFYAEAQAAELVARRMAQLESALERTTLETPRLDGVVVEGFAARLPDGGFLLTFRDITPRQRAEEALQRSREHLRTLVETVPHGILECDLKGEVTFANEAYARMQANVQSGDLGGKTIFELIGDEESRGEARATFARKRQEGREHGVELVRNRDRDGRTLWRQVDWTVRRSAVGEINGFIGVVTDVTEKHQAEEQMRSANEVLHQLIYSAPMAIVTLNRAGEVLLWNQAAAVVFGWREDEATGQCFSLLGLASAEQQRFAGMLSRSCAGETVRDEVVAVRRDGRPLDAAVAIGPLHGTLAASSDAVLIIEDISERKRVESALRNSEETYRNLVQATPVAIFVHVEGALVFLNPAAVALFGAKGAVQLEGRQVEEFLDPISREKFLAAVAEAQQDTGRTNRLQLRIAPLSGGVREIEATFLGVEYSGCEARMAICLDVTERNRSEAALRNQAEFMQKVLDTIPAPIFYMNAAGLYLGCNHAFVALVGMPREAIIGRNVYAVAASHLAEGFDKSNRDLLAVGGISKYETEIETLIGRREVLMTKAVFHDPDGVAAGLVGTMLDISERKQAEEALRDSERKYRAIFDQAFQFSGLLDQQGRLLEVNRSALEFIGAGSEDVRGQLFWETPWWSSLPDYQQRVRAAVERGVYGESARFEVVNRGVNGREHWLDFSLRPVRDDWGAVVYLVAEGRDITERKRAEELTMLVARGVAAETGENFFRSLTRNLAQALRADFAFVGEIRGDDVHVVAGIARGEELTPFSYALASTPCADVARGRAVCTFPAAVTSRFPDDHLLVEMEVEGYVGTPLLDSNGNPLGILVVLFVRPIKQVSQVESLLQIFASRAAAELERRRAERVLEASEARFRQLSHEFATIFNGIPDSLTVWEPQRQMVWANRASQEFYRLSVEELLGQRCEEVCRFDTCGGDQCEIRRCFAIGRVEDTVRVTPDGRSWGIKTFPLRDESGEVIRVIHLASDISERVRLREEAARASHLAALGELAAGVAHEINNPTGLILLDLPIIRDAFADCLPILEAHYRHHGEFALAGLDYSHLRDELPLLLAEVIDGAQRIKQIVEELKDFARPFDARQFVPLDLCKVVRKAVHLVGNQLKKATDHFELHCDVPVPLCHGNAQRLEQVLINLILNACQALPGRDRGIAVTVRHQPEEELNLIEVRDDGVGIRPEHLTQVTDPFFTTRREVGGTGLGLSVSTRIIEEHGGTLHFASLPERGTVVTVALPILVKEEENHG